MLASMAARLHYSRIALGVILVAVLSALLICLIYWSVHYELPNPMDTLIVRYRFNRVLSAVTAGLVLGIAGASLQGCLKNPLVDHYILGVGSGALFAVLLTILVYGYSLSIAPIAAMAGGLLALSLSIFIAESIGGTDASYVLAGLGVNALFSGLSIMLTYMVAMRYAFAIYFLVGSFTLASDKYYLTMLVSAFILLASYPILAKPLNAVLLGDEHAKQLGYNPRIYRFLAVVSAGIASSLIVSCFGIIGFIGLVSPHISRFLIKSVDHRVVIPLSGLVGAILLLLTDDFVRLILSDYVGEIPTGAIVSIFGAPFFLTLLLTRFRRGLR